MKTFKGRVISKRKRGDYLFLDIEGLDKFQLVIEYVIFNIRKGDIIEGYGEIDEKNKFGLSILVSEISLISSKTKDIRMKFNPRALKLKSELLYGLRDFLHRKEYVEVDLPIIVKGENTSKARSFKTQHLTVSGDLYLRKSLDCFLRELTIFDIDKVFCIGKIFRNEHITTLRQPESQILSVYSNYLSITDTILFLKRMLIDISERLEYNGASSLIFNEIDVVDYGKIREINSSYKTFKKELLSPTIITNYPSHQYTVAKNTKGNNEFKLVYKGITLAHGINEITDSEELTRKFNEQSNKSLDISSLNLINSMSRGCPPCTSIGISIERLLLTMFPDVSYNEIVPYPFSRLKK